MAIEKMVLLKIVGSIEEMHPILKELILCENVHLSFDNSNAYDNNYMVHQYESVMTTGTPYMYMRQNYDEQRNKCIKYLQVAERLCSGIGIELKIDKKSVAGSAFSAEEAYSELDRLSSLVGGKVEEINGKKQEIKDLTNFKEKISCIDNKNVDFDKIADLNYFDYEIGALSRENKVRIKKNYENISAIVLRIGIIKSSVEDMYIIIYPRQFRDETEKLLKSLNWNRLKIPEYITGSASEMISQADGRIETLKSEIESLSSSIEIEKEENKYLFNKIYTTIKLEKKILEVGKEVSYGENVFVLNAWVREKDKMLVEDAIGSVTNKFIVTEKSAEEVNKPAMPPTEFKNNKFTKPFEMIVRLYGLPSYYEIDPTPFLAVTFCLMFGIMFGDIGQGLVYFLAGVALSQRIPVPSQILKRLGLSSTAFGFVYGSLFGLEQEQLSWLPSLIGKPLDPKNIPMILVAGVVFGIVVLTVSFVFGVLNSLRRGDIEEGIFGKNGVAGYVFFMSLILSVVCVTGIIGLPVSVPLTLLILSLAVMILKKPITNLVINRKPLINGSLGSYLTESIFEGVETILNALSNAISFIRVGAFALNHAGLFLAFLVMSELVPGILLKIIILALGNVLILTLEGLVVFIQGLRLQYYEMFSKYFNGDGVAYAPMNIND